MFGARQAVTKNTPFGKTAGEKMNKSEKKTIEKMVEKQIGKLAKKKPGSFLFYFDSLYFFYHIVTRLPDCYCNLPWPY